MQRVISPMEVIPEDQRATSALNEEKLGIHFEKYFLAKDNRQQTFVFSSPTGGIHVYCFAPSKLLCRNYWTLVSMGMSGTKMKVPEDIKDGHLVSHAEVSKSSFLFCLFPFSHRLFLLPSLQVLCYLPPEWQFPPSLGGNVTEENWPIEMLRSLVRYVRTTGAWLAEDHGIPNLLTDPVGGRFVESTKLSHMVLLAPVNEDEDFACVDINNTRVTFYVVIPITTAEATWKREMGAEKSIYYVVGSQEEGGDDVLIDYVIDPNRPCTVDDLNCREIFDNQSIADSDYGEYEDLDDIEDLDDGEVADDEELTDSNNNTNSGGSNCSGSGIDNSTESAGEEDSPSSGNSTGKVRFQLSEKDPKHGGRKNERDSANRSSSSEGDSGSKTTNESNSSLDNAAMSENHSNSTTPTSTSEADINCSVAATESSHSGSTDSAGKDGHRYRFKGHRNVHRMEGDEPEGESRKVKRIKADGSSQ